MVRLFIPITLFALGILSDAYIYHRYIAAYTASVWRWFWWIPTLSLLLLAVYFIFFYRGLEAEYTTTNIFLLLLALFFIPKILFTPLSFIPYCGKAMGLAVAAGIWGIVLWGITGGFCQLRVRHVTYTSADVPPAFDGYRIVQFSDAHVGTFRGAYAGLLKKSVDTINAQKPDLVCFVGDIENFSPKELTPHAEAFSSLRAKDGVFTIMGNHDYSSYIRVSPGEQARLVHQTRQMQQDFGWRLLSNANATIRRGGDSITIIGEENWGKPPFPQFGKLDKALAGLTAPYGFTVMLSHDPTAWRAHILPVFRPNITLSGHTHGTQFSIFGWSPASMVYKEWGGEYYDGPSLLNVSTGFGGNFPFRFGMPREIVVITLKRK